MTKIAPHAPLCATPHKSAYISEPQAPEYVQRSSVISCSPNSISSQQDFHMSTSLQTMSEAHCWVHTQVTSGAPAISPHCWGAWGGVGGTGVLGHIIPGSHCFCWAGPRSSVFLVTSKSHVSVC